VSRGGSACEQENPEVCEGVGISNQSGPIVSSHKSTMSSSSYSSPIVRARPQLFKKAPGPPPRVSLIPVCRNIIAMASQPPSSQVTVRNIPPVILHPLQSPSKLLRHPRNLATIEHFSPPILFTARIHFPPILIHNQGYPKVCPDPLNLSSADDSLCRNAIVIFLSFVFPHQGLNCFDLESSRVFSVKHPEPSLFSNQ
jgi:hypothetical protein